MGRPLVVLSLLVLVCTVERAAGQTPATTPAPTTAADLLDNTIINTSHVDVVTEYIVDSLFDAPDQRYWRFLEIAARDLTAAGVSVTPRSSLHEQLNSPTPTTAALGIRPFRYGVVAIPYERFNQYMVTLIHVGTRRHLNDLVVAINNGTLQRSLAVSSAQFVPSIDEIYDGGSVDVGTGDGQLELGWHVLLVVGVCLVYFLLLAAKYRTTTASQEARKREATNEDDLLHTDNVELNAYRWEEDDLDDQQQTLIDRAVENERVRKVRGLHPHRDERSRDLADDLGEYLDEDTIAMAGGAGSAEAAAAAARRKQLRESRVVLADVAENDRLAKAAGTLSYAALTEGDPDAIAAAAEQPEAAERQYSLQHVRDVLDLDPRLNLPPVSTDETPAVTQRRARSKSRRAARAALMAVRMGKKAKDVAAAAADADDKGEDDNGDEDDDFELPDAGLDDNADFAAQEEARKRKRPLGLAARRLAHMMTTMAGDQSSLNSAFQEHTVHRSYQLALPPVASPLRQRRLNQAVFEPHDEVVGPNASANEESPSPARLANDEAGIPTDERATDVSDTGGGDRDSEVPVASADESAAAQAAATHHPQPRGPLTAEDMDAL